MARTRQPSSQRKSRVKLMMEQACKAIHTTMMMGYMYSLRPVNSSRPKRRWLARHHASHSVGVQAAGCQATTVHALKDVRTMRYQPWMLAAHQMVPVMVKAGSALPAVRGIVLLLHPAFIEQRAVYLKARMRATHTVAALALPGSARRTHPQAVQAVPRQWATVLLQVPTPHLWLCTACRQVPPKSLRWQGPRALRRQAGWPRRPMRPMPIHRRTTSGRRTTTSC